MNKKGFTLIELMVTVGLLALMGVIIGVNITSILKSTQKNEEDFDKETTEKAACVYVDSSANNKKCLNRTKPCTEISIKDLTDSGLLDERFISKTGTITISWNDGEKICTYNN